MHYLNSPVFLTSWWTSLVVEVSVWVVHVPELVVLLVVLLVVRLHALVWPQTPWWGVQLFLGMVNPLRGETDNFTNETRETDGRKSRREKEAERQR